jgi:NitT/TauT family transport system permease protein
MLGDARFMPHIAETLVAFAQGFAIAVAVGLLIGVPLGAARFAGEVGEPVLVALYSIPKVTLYPVILLIFGIGMPAKVAFGAIHGIVPISIFALNAVRNINPTHLRTARTLRLSPMSLFAKVLLPAALPEIVTGIRVGFSLALIGTLLGEMFGSQRGLGHLLMQAMSLHNIERILALTLLLVAFAAGVNALLLALDRHLHRDAK